MFLVNMFAYNHYSSILYKNNVYIACLQSIMAYMRSNGAPCCLQQVFTRNLACRHWWAIKHAWNCAWCPLTSKTSYHTGSPLKTHDDVIKWKHFPRYWPFVRGIHWSPVNSLHKGQWRGTLFSLICVWINGWVNNRETGDLRRYRAHCDVIVMIYQWVRARKT